MGRGVMEWREWSCGGGDGVGWQGSGVVVVTVGWWRVDERVEESEYGERLMGYEGDLTVLTFNKAVFTPMELMNVPVPLDLFPVNALTSKVFSFMVKNEVSGENQGGQSSSDRSLLGNEGGMTLQSVYDLCISVGTRAWMKSVSLKQRLTGKKSLKLNCMQKESVSKQGRKSAKAEPSVHKDPLFDELPEDTLDYMETEDAQDVGRTRKVVNEEKETVNDEVSTEDVLSTAQQKVSTDKKKVSTDRPNVSTDRPKVSFDMEI
ncbi:hypothetical protein Tco_1392384 [Tanacetum coccineum]